MAVTSLTNGGEREGARDAIARQTKQLIDAGMKPDQAKQTSRDAALRFERQNPNRK